MRSIIRMPALARLLLVLVTVEVTSVGLTAAPEHDPLPSWKDGQSKAAIMTFVARVTDEGFGLIEHHTDAEREWAYDRSSHIGTLDKALDEATTRGWAVVDMKNEWKTIYPEG